MTVPSVSSSEHLVPFPPGASPHDQPVNLHHSPRLEEIPWPLPVFLAVVLGLSLILTLTFSFLMFCPGPRSLQLHLPDTNPPFLHGPPCPSALLLRLQGSLPTLSGHLLYSTVHSTLQFTYSDLASCPSPWVLRTSQNLTVVPSSMRCFFLSV